jgi:GNAT superfamily N-acetyltransferase
MTGYDWYETPIAKSHNRQAFDCGDSDLNDYLRRFARQNHQSGGSKTYVATVRSDSAIILGYYSLSPGSMEYEQTPEVLRRSLGRYEVPVYRLGRLAVARQLQGQGLGGQLLLLAGRRCLRAADEVGGVGMAIDAKNERVAMWYERFGAIRLDDASLSLVLPFSSIRNVLEDMGHGQ